MSKIVYFVFLLLVVSGVGQLAAQPAHRDVLLSADYQKHFDKYSVRGSVIVFDLKNNVTYTFDEARTRKRFSPASTFKIFNSLVGLETGVIPDTSCVIAWDGVHRGNYPPWNRSNSLKSAFRHSVVWYYRELARRVGPGQMQRYISLNNYGNESIRDSLDGFWLTDLGGKLQISQVEQIDFLRKLYAEKLKFSKRSQQLVKAILLMYQDDHKLYAKTGMSSADDLWYGWFVGWVERRDNVYFFATHIESPQSKMILSGARQGVTRSVLEQLTDIRWQE